jgi:hypothetical protein
MAYSFAVSSLLPSAPASFSSQVGSTSSPGAGCLVEALGECLQTRRTAQQHNTDDPLEKRLDAWQILFNLFSTAQHSTAQRSAAQRSTPAA